jgi:hypothetical protein
MVAQEMDWLHVHNNVQHTSTVLCGNYGNGMNECLVARIIGI